MVKLVLGMDWEREVATMFHDCEVCGQRFSSLSEAKEHEQNCPQLHVEQVNTSY